MRSPLALVVALAPLAATPLLAGPPWISIEYPVNPYDARARGAVLLVHAFHHGAEIDDSPVTGTAEGLVNGQRKSIRLEFTRTSRPAVFALRNQWGTTGEWALVIAVASSHQPAAEAAQALVRVSGDRILSVEVPTRQANGYSFPRPITSEEIEASLARR
jgi:hypothetical protein